MTNKLCLLLLVALVGTAAACGGSDEKESPTASGGAKSTATPQDATPEAGSGASTPEGEDPTPVPTTTATGGDRLEQCKQLVNSITKSLSDALTQAADKYCAAAQGEKWDEARASTGPLCEAMMKEMLSADSVPDEVLKSSTKACEDNLVKFIDSLQ